MRTIEFRAWDGERFFYFDMFKDKGNYTLSYNDISGWNINLEPVKPHDFWLCGDSSDKKMILQQLTGLHDKNGKGIYGGDILKSEFGHIGIVKYEVKLESGFIIEWDDGDICRIFNDAAHCDPEIIGNVYENPELINKEK